MFFCPALLKLRAVGGTCAKKSRTVGSVCLPQQPLRPGLSCEIAGYGKEKHGEETSPLRIRLNPPTLAEWCPGAAAAGSWFRSQYLRETQVNVIADDVCRQDDYYGDLITGNMFCAGQPDWSRDACEVFRTVQAGSDGSGPSDVPLSRRGTPGGRWCVRSTAGSSSLG